MQKPLFSGSPFFGAAALYFYAAQILKFSKNVNIFASINRYYYVYN